MGRWRSIFFLSQAGVVILDEQTLQNSKSRIWFPSSAFKLKDAVRQLGVIRYRHTDHKRTQELAQNVHICTCLTRLRHKSSVKGKYSVSHQNEVSTTLDLPWTPALQSHSSAEGAQNCFPSTRISGRSRDGGNPSIEVLILSLNLGNSQLQL